MRTPVCDLLGIAHPIVGFTPSEHVAAAISRAGGLGVLGCVRFNDPAELDAVLDWMDANTDGRPYGVDVVMPARVPAEGAVRDLEELIPPAHRDFVAQTLLELGVPPLPDGAPGGEGVIGWLHSVARKHVEVALSHPRPADRQRPRPAAAGRHRQRAPARHAGGGAGGEGAARPRPGRRRRRHRGRPGVQGRRAHRRDREHGAHPGDRRRGRRPGAGARRGRDRLRPPDRRRARARRGRGLDGLGLASHPGVRADDQRHRGPAGAARGHLVRHRSLADLQREARPAAEEPLDGGLGAARRARAAADAAAEPARRPGAPAAHAGRGGRTWCRCRPGRSSAGSPRSARSPT